MSWALDKSCGNWYPRRRDHEQSDHPTKRFHDANIMILFHHQQHQNREDLKDVIVGTTTSPQSRTNGRESLCGLLLFISPSHQQTETDASIDTRDSVGANLRTTILQQRPKRGRSLPLACWRG